MKKQLLTALVLAGLLVSGKALWANGTPVPDVVSEGVEITGAVDVVAGWQHDDADAASGLGGLFDFGIARGPNADHIRFVINEVEVDLQKTFGENIRLRADIDFNDLGDSGFRGADIADLEQAYVTANIAAGNGIEFLIGKFNAPVGVELVDIRDNWLISLAPPLRFMIPTNVTGVKIYYAFSDSWDFHLAAVNDLNSNGFGDSVIPSALFRLGYNWGDEGNESTIGLSGGAGPESDAIAGGASNNAHWDFFGDLDALIALSDTISLAAEGVFRQSNSIAGGANQKAIAGLLGLNFEASDVWDVSLRAGWEWEINPVTGSGASTTGGFWNGGMEGTILSGTIGVGYMITDDAKMKWEGRYDWGKNAAAGGANDDAMSVLAEFAYSF